MDTSNLNILILGHKGMVGNVVCDFLKSQNISLTCTNLRWGSYEFKEFIKNNKCNYVINCIGCIPQKCIDVNLYKYINFELPVFIYENFKGMCIHISSDSEDVKDGIIEGLDDNIKYYIDSKRKSFEYLFNKSNTFIIKSSIIGPEINDNNKSLWSWIQNNSHKTIYGYTNHFWNGITNLQFAKICNLIICGTLNERYLKLGTNTLSKYDLLNILNIKMKLNKIVIPKESNNICINTEIDSNLELPKIEDQIQDLIDWKYKIN